MNVFKGLAMTFAAVLILAAVACGDSSPPPSSDTPSVDNAPAAQTVPSDEQQSVSPISAGSMIPRYADVDDLIARSHIILVGVIDQDFEEKMLGAYGPDGQPSTDKESAFGVTDYQINIEEVIKGDETVSTGTESVTLRLFGHLNVQRAVVNSGFFKLPEPGDRLLFALGRNPDGTYGSGPEGLINIESENAAYADGIAFASGGTTAELLEKIKTCVSQ